MRTFVDLFAGIGGFHIGLEKHGLKCVWSSELQPRVAEIYKQNFGLTPHGDITKIHASEIPRHDVLCAGFPCKTFSSLAQGVHPETRRMSDPRTYLYREIVRIAKHHQPQIILLENVPRITQPNRRAFLDTLIEDFREAGYRVDYRILNAAEHGSPQRRERCYFVLIREGLGLRMHWPEPQKPSACVRDILDATEEEIDEYCYIKHPLNNEDREIRLFARRHWVHWRGMIIAGKVIRTAYDKAKFNSMFQIRHIDGLGATVLPCNQALYCFDDYSVRHLTVKEIARLQGFPDNYIWSDSRRLNEDVIGNSVIPQMISIIYSGIH